MLERSQIFNRSVSLMSTSAFARQACCAAVKGSPSHGLPSTLDLYTLRQHINNHQTNSIYTTSTLHPDLGQGVFNLAHRKRVVHHACPGALRALCRLYLVG